MNLNSNFFTKWVPSKMLSLFRVFFGFILIFQFYKFSKRIAFFEDPEYLYFPYPELEWIPVVSPIVLWICLFIGVICSTGVLLGVFFRYSIIISTITFFYFFSLDSIYFNNHYYLIFLLSFLMCFTNADGQYSLKKKKVLYVPNWQYLIFQFMIAIVFFYGGVSKLSSDWLSGRVLEGIHDSILVTNFLVYSGTFFDLLIPFFLFIKRTRWLAIILVLGFNISNHFIFDDISSFPFLMIASLLLFLNEAVFPKKVNQWAGLEIKISDRAIPISKITFSILIVFFIFQLIFPLRSYFIAGHPEWTGQGHYFSWRMKSYKKDVDLKVFAFDKQKLKRAYQVNHKLTDYEIQRSCAMPHMIPRLANHIKKKIEKMDGYNPNLGISVDYHVSLNGYPSQLAIDPNLDISKEDYLTLGKNQWLLPFNPNN